MNFATDSLAGGETTWDEEKQIIPAGLLGEMFRAGLRAGAEYTFQVSLFSFTVLVSLFSISLFSFTNYSGSFGRD